MQKLCATIRYCNYYYFDYTQLSTGIPDVVYLYNRYNFPVVRWNGAKCIIIIFDSYTAHDPMVDRPKFSTKFDHNGIGSFQIKIS